MVARLPRSGPPPQFVAFRTLEDVAAPSNVRLGRGLAAEGEVQVITTTATRVEARVGGGRSGTQRRRVERRSTQQKLSSSCTCTSEPRLFCKHLVAVTLATRTRLQ